MILVPFERSHRGGHDGASFIKIGSRGQELSPLYVSYVFLGLTTVLPHITGLNNKKVLATLYFSVNI